MIWCTPPCAGDSDDDAIVSYWVMRSVYLATILAACGGGDAPPLSVTTQFVVTEASGTGPSPLDQLAGQAVAVQIDFDSVGAVRSEDGPCKALVLFTTDAIRTARGASAAIVEREILDLLPSWDVRLELCDNPAQSSFLAESTINELNLLFGCIGVPTSAAIRDAEGFPLLSSFTATGCSATILDVVNNRVIGNPSFTMTVATGPARLP